MSLLGSWVRRGLAATRAAPLLHRLALRDRLTVLMYHAVLSSPLKVPDWSFLDERVFRTQVEYLTRHFDVVPLSEALRRLRGAGPRRPTAVLTFDDGFHSVHDVVLPVLKRLGLPATAFLVSSLVGTDGTLWFCRLNRALGATTRASLEWREQRFDFGTARQRAHAGVVLQAGLKELPHAMLVHELSAIIGALGDDPARPVPPASPYRMLGLREVEALAASGLFEFGAHGESHAILSRLPLPQRESEIDGSLRAVAQLTGRPCRFFSYPNGGAADYDRDVKRMLAERQVEAAVTSIAGPNVARTPRLELRRYGIGPDMDDDEFRLTVHHTLPWRWRSAQGAGA